LCSRFGAQAALFVPGGRSSCRPQTVLVESASLVFVVFVACSCVPFFRSIFSAVFRCSEFGGRSAWGPRTVRLGSVDSPRGGCWSQTVRGVSTDGPLLLVQYWRFVSLFRTVRRYLTDGPQWARGQSAVGSRTVRPKLADRPPGTAQGC
jgi:hypothetical protein